MRTISDEYIDTEVEFFDCTCVRATAKALLVECGGSEVWIPKSVLHIGTELEDAGDVGTIVVPDWFADKQLEDFLGS